MEKENSKSSKKGLLVTLIIVLCIGIFGTVYYFKSNNEPTKESITDTENIDLTKIQNYVNKKPAILKNVDVIEAKNCDTESLSYACITLKNKSGRNLTNLLVVIDEYDKDGNIIDDSSDSIKSFAAGAEYTFKIPLTRENIVKWELSNIDEY